MPHSFGATRDFAVAQVDCAGRLVFFDPYFAELFDVAPEALLGRSFVELTHPNDLHMSRTLFANILKNKMPYRIEKTYVAPDGRAIPIIAHVCVIEEKGGVAKGVAAIVQLR